MGILRYKGGGDDNDDDDDDDDDDDGCNGRAVEEMPKS